MLIQKSRLPIRDILLFGFLPSSLKKVVYRLKGYRIGKNVSIGIGSVICGEEVYVGDHTTIGFFTVIRGKAITIGSHVSIGATTILDTPYLEIGDGSKINEQVFVGGLQFPDSKLVLGKNCQVMQMSFINPAKSIIVGDDSGIGGHSLVFTHSSWGSQFEGYPIEFAPIEIGKSVSIAWRVFLFPGIKIGDGAVIGANSLVHQSIPPKCFAVGFPARVFSQYPKFPKEVTEEEKVDILRNIVDEMINYFMGSGLICAQKERFFEIALDNRRSPGRKQKTWRLRVAYEDFGDGKKPFLNEGIDVLLSLRQIPKEVRRSLNSIHVMWIDIERKEQPLFWNDLGEEVTDFLKRYGVRLFRVEE